MPQPSVQKRKSKDADLPKGIFRGSRGGYEFRGRDAGGKPVTKTGRDLGEVEEFKAEFERKKAQGQRLVRSIDVPIYEEHAAVVMAEFKSGLGTGHRKPLAKSTFNEYVELLERYLLPHFAHLPLTEINKASFLANWQRERLDEQHERNDSRGSGACQLGKAQGLHARIMKRAVLPHEYLEQSVAEYLDPPSWEKLSHRWLTAGEVEALRMWYLERDDIGSAAFISCMAYIGPRPQDFLAAEWKNLRRTPPAWVRRPGHGSGGLLLPNRNSYGEILVGSKSRAEEKFAVYVPGPVMGDLDLWQAEGPDTGWSAYVYPRSVDGGPWSKTDYNNWRHRAEFDWYADAKFGLGLCGCGCGEAPPVAAKSWAKRGHVKGQALPLVPGHRARRTRAKRPPCFTLACEEVGLGPDVSPYALRHTAASLQAAAGATDVEIGHQLRHGPDTSRRNYQHLIHEALRTDATIDDYIREARGIARAPEEDRVRVA